MTASALFPSRPADAPGSPLAGVPLGALGASLTHTTLVLAAERAIRVDGVQVFLSGPPEPPAQHPGEPAPAAAQPWCAVLHIESPAPPAEIEALHAAVERACPVLNLRRHPQAIRTELRHVRPDPFSVGACGGTA